MKLALTACVEVRVDEEAHATYCSDMWEAHDRDPDNNPAPHRSGYGGLMSEVSNISFELACEMRLDWEASTYSDLLITLHDGTEEQYANYEAELIKRLNHLKQWVRVIP